LAEVLGIKKVIDALNTFLGKNNSTGILGDVERKAQSL
jgi:hypothetical protein